MKNRTKRMHASTSDIALMLWYASIQAHRSTDRSVDAQDTAVKTIKENGSPNTNLVEMMLGCAGRQVLEIGINQVKYISEAATNKLAKKQINIFWILTIYLTESWQTWRRSYNSNYFHNPFWKKLLSMFGQNGEFEETKKLKI